MHPVIALVTAGVEMDVLGIAFAEFTDAEREAVVNDNQTPFQAQIKLSASLSLARSASSTPSTAILQLS